MHTSYYPVTYLVVPTNLTKVCRDSSVPRFLSESCTSSACWYSAACMVDRVHTSRNCANQSQVSHRDNISDPPPNGSWSYSAIGSAPMADRLSMWLVHRSGIDSLRDPVTGGNSFRQSLKTFLFATYWCIQRIRSFTMMLYINRLFTYLLDLIWLCHMLHFVISLSGNNLDSNFNVWDRPLMSICCEFSHSSFLDVSRSNGGLRISGWVGQLLCLTIFSTSLSAAAFLIYHLDLLRDQSSNVQQRRTIQ